MPGQVQFPSCLDQSPASFDFAGKVAHHRSVFAGSFRIRLTDWQRHRANPIIRPGKNQWDHDAVYKPYAIIDGKQWMLWYNGRKGGVEQIGLALHQGEDLAF